MKRNGSGLAHAKRFADAHNNVAAYPKLKDVAAALGLSLKSVENYAAILRKRGELDETLPKLIARTGVRGKAAVVVAPVPVKTPTEHTMHRAKSLKNEMNRLFTSTLYPVINPEAMVTIANQSFRYDRITGGHVETTGKLKSWITDTLKVEPVKDCRGKRFIFTGAQNDAPIHEEFWENLLAYAEAIDASVVVGPWTYATNWWDENNPSARNYDEAIERYLCFGQMRIGPNFVFCGEMNTLPTSSDPISDLTVYVGGKWAVFPHSTVQLVSVPAINPMEQASQIMSTGAVTMPRVIPRKAGVKSIAMHKLGATIVEFDHDGDLFCRQITGMPDGSFQDLDVSVHDGRVLTGSTVQVMTAADMHVAKLNPVNALGSFGYDYVTGAVQANSMLEMLKPELLVVHDIHDNESRGHHTKDDVGYNYAMAVRGRESVETEVRRSADFLASMSERVPSILVVESNHDIALERYVREARYRMDGINFRFGLEMDLALCKAIEVQALQVEAGLPTTKFSLLEWAIREIAEEDLDQVSWVYDGGSFVLNGVQLGFHGFRGPNGTRGTIVGFARLGHPITIGDKHSPAIQFNLYCGGVMELQQGYNKGPSAWAVAHVIQYPNGSRTIVTLQNGKWRSHS